MNLTPKELLTALKYCHGQLGVDSCDGCPNQKPDSVDKFGVSECRFNLNLQIMDFLEDYLRKEELS